MRLLLPRLGHRRASRAVERSGDETLRCHDDASLHPQDKVSNINVGEGPAFVNVKARLWGRSGAAGLEQSRIEESRAVIASAVPGWATPVPFWDLRQGLSGEESHCMGLIDGVVGPYHGVANMDVDVLRKISHDCRIVEYNIAACI
jgi:hypothetical protein